MRKTPIQNVSDTAYMVAAYRALENENPHPLFRDPLAGRLAGDKGKKIIENLPRRAFMGGWSVVIRTCLIDQLIESAIAEGVDTVLNLGAGLDTRPYRLDLPHSLRWIEVDFPHVIALKEVRLAEEKARCRLERVKVDLTDVQQRLKFLSKVAAESQKILVLTEGVIPYLTSYEVASLAHDLKSNPRFALWIADYFSPESYRYRKRRRMTQVMRNAPFRFEPQDYFGFFRKQGWRPKEIRYLPEEAERLNRPIPWPWLLRQWLKIVTIFMSPRRRAAMKKFMGYVVFEPMEPTSGENFPPAQTPDR